MSIFTGLQRPQFQAYYDEAFLIEHRFENGMGFPPSYIDYVKTLGYGRLCGLWNIHIPLGDHPDSWLHRCHNWRPGLMMYWNQKRFYKKRRWSQMVFRSFWSMRSLSLPVERMTC